MHSRLAIEIPRLSLKYQNKYQCGASPPKAHHHHPCGSMPVHQIHVEKRKRKRQLLTGEDFAEKENVAFEASTPTYYIEFPNPQNVPTNSCSIIDETFSHFSAHHTYLIHHKCGERRYHKNDPSGGYMKSRSI
jgi:hypothetical protein